jgi:tRNA-modifying protein YgfZ
MPLHTPFHEVISKAGARFCVEEGWEIPANLGNPGQVYEHACEGAALFDSSHHAKIELAGLDATQFLQNLCTNDVRKAAPGHGCEAFLTTNQAKIVAYILIYPHQTTDRGPVLALDAGPGMAERVAKHLDRYLVSEQVEIIDRTLEFGQLHLAGPEAGTVLGKALSFSGLEDLQHRKVNFAGGTIILRRHSPLSVPGFDILMAPGQAASLWNSLLASGAVPAGIEIYQTLRVEAGTPQYGIDIDDTNLPQEVDRLDRTVSFTKGCFIGQETIARIRTYGHVNRLLVGLKLEGQGTEPRGTKLFRDGKEVGQLTSCVVSPRLGSVIAMAYVRRGSHEPGTKIEVGEAGGRKAEAGNLPFIKSSQ